MIEFPSPAAGTGSIELFHGSREGIEGAIRPISRSHCDFGRGFYMGTEETQPLTLVCTSPRAVFYRVRLALDGLAITSFKADLAWALFVAFGRGKLDDLQVSPLYRSLEQLRASSDVIVGPIANDRMFVVLERFFNGEITDAAFVGSMSALKLGDQYVAVTQSACDAVEILEERHISDEERADLSGLSQERRAKGVRLADEICRAHRRDGSYFDEILESLHLDATRGDGAA